MLLLGERIKSTKLSIRTSHQFASPTSPLKKKRHGPREVNTHVFHIREIKRGYNELQLLVLFKLSDASFFSSFFSRWLHWAPFPVLLQCPPIRSHPAPTAVLQTWMKDQFNRTFSGYVHVSPELPFFRLKHYRILSFPLGVSLPRNAVGQLWIHPSP